MTGDQPWRTIDDRIDTPVCCAKSSWMRFIEPALVRDTPESIFSKTQNANREFPAKAVAYTKRGCTVALRRKSRLSVTVIEWYVTVIKRINCDGHS